MIKKVSIITPNIPEAEILTNTKIKTKEDMIVVAQKLIELGAKNVLIKGGHLKGEFVHDIYVNITRHRSFFKIQGMAWKTGKRNKN